MLLLCWSWFYKEIQCVYEAYGEDKIQKAEVRQRVNRDYMKRDGGEEERDWKRIKKLPRKVIFFKRQISRIVDV